MCFLDENVFCDEESTLNTMFLQTGLSKYTHFFDENLVCNKDFTIKHMHFNTNLRSKNLKNELLAEEIAVKHNVFTLFS